IRGSSIYDAGRFNGITLSPATQELIGATELSSDEKMRLNQLLLLDAYRGQVTETAATGELLEKLFLGGLSNEERVRLNHLLLIHAFPDFITDQDVSLEATATELAVNAAGFTAIPTFIPLGAAS